MQSLHGKVTTWKMTPEELEAYKKKYPIKAPLDSNKKRRRWKRITKKIYQKYRNEGLTDEQICVKIDGLNPSYLADAKKRWGVE